MLESLRIKGQHFDIETQLEFLTGKGYKVKNKVVARNAATFLFPSPIPKLRVKSGQFDKLAATFQVDMTLLELDFDEFRIWHKGDCQNIALDQLKLLQSKKMLKLLKKMHGDVDGLASGSIFDPVIAENVNQCRINDFVFQEYIKCLIPKLADQECEYLVVSGEMVWSGWINDQMLLRLLSQSFTRSFFVAIDKNAIWANVRSTSLGNSTMHKLHKEVFEPDAYYLAEQVDKLVLKNAELTKEIYVRDNALNIFEGVSELCLSDGIVCPDKLFVKTALMDPVTLSDNFYSSVLQKITVVDYSRCVLGKEFIRGQALSIYDEHIKLNISENTEFYKDEEIGEIRKEKRYVYDLKPYKTKMKVVVNHGLLVDKGDVLACSTTAAGKFFGEEFVSSTRGYVDLSLIEDDLIIIHKSEEAVSSVKAEYNGTLVQKKFKGKYVVKTDYINYKMRMTFGKAVSGIIHTKSNYKYGADCPKIIIVDSIEAFNLTPEEIIMNSIVGVIALTMNYDGFLDLISRKTRLLNMLTISIVDAFTNGTNHTYSNLINRLNSRSCTIEGNNIKVIDVYRHQDESIDNVESDIGKNVIVLSYQSQFRYHKVLKRIHKDRYILTSNNSIIEANIANIIFLN